MPSPMRRPAHPVSMLRARVITALILLGALLVALFWLPDGGWAVFVAGVVGAAAWEWGGLCGFAPGARAAYGLALAAALLALWALILYPETAVTSTRVGRSWIYGAGCGFWLAVVPAWLARRWRLSNLALAAGVGVVVLIPAALALIHLHAVDPILVLAVMSMVWVADIVAYFSGRAFGRRKLAPQISPGKTWEGAAGAALGVVAYGALVVLVWHGGISGWSGSNVLWALSGLVLFTAVSILGDLFESLLKRQAGVKDSGRLLPGHGGVLDRIDSLTSTLPLAGLVLVWWRA